MELIFYSSKKLFFSRYIIDFMEQGHSKNFD